MPVFELDKREFEKLAKLVTSSILYKSIVIKAWKSTVDETFASAAFGTWSPLHSFTVQSRKAGFGYYDKPHAAGVKPSGPPNVWTNQLRDAVAGRSASGFSGVTVTRARLSVNVRLSYAEAAFQLRPLDQGSTLKAVEAVLQAKVQFAMNRTISKVAT